jgi:hypothetical protein
MLALLIFSSLLFLEPLAKDSTYKTQVELRGSFAASGNTPLWQRSLQYGQMPLQSNTAIGIIKHEKTDNLKSDLNWKYGIEATAWGGKTNDLILTQAYIRGRFKKWELWAGRRKEVYGIGDTSNTSGIYAWSGNAIPTPKIQFGTSDYINLFNGWIGVHMTYSHGWLDNQGAVINSYLHQKSLYGRIGKPNSLFSVFGGLNHNATWGGENKVKTGGIFDKYPSGLNTYFYVITLLKDRNIVSIDPNSTWDDTNGFYGNHLGSFDMAIKYHPSWGEILLYKQTAYETGRALSLAQFNDGLVGLSLKLKNIKLVNSVTIEYLYTANQGNFISGFAQLFKIRDPHLVEIENYYNNTRGGWQYMGKGIGSPLVIIDRESSQGGGNYFSLNAVKSYYAGIKGVLPGDIFYHLRLSQSYYSYPRNHLKPRLQSADFIPQLAWGLNLEKTISSSFAANINFAGDHGERSPNTLGGLVGIKYRLP